MLLPRSLAWPQEAQRADRLVSEVQKSGAPLLQMFSVSAPLRPFGTAHAQMEQNIYTRARSELLTQEMPGVLH